MMKAELSDACTYIKFYYDQKINVYLYLDFKTMLTKQ